MPMYVFLCEKCGNRTEHYFSITNLPTAINCNCGGRMTQTLSSINVGGDESDYARKRFPYYDESLDRTFKSLSEKKRYLAASGYRQVETGEKYKERQKAKLPDGVSFFIYKDKSQYESKMREIYEKKKAGKR